MPQMKKILFILLGNFCVALGTVFFVVPAGFITGGATGLALALEAFFHLPISWGIAIISITLLLIGWATLGREFAATSAVSTVCYPLFVAICEGVAQHVHFSTDSTVLNLASAALLYGYGVGTVMRHGASTGGLDAIAMILYKKKGVNLSMSVNLFELLTMLTQVAYSNAEEIIGGVLLTIFYTAVMNHFLAKGVARVQVLIYSQCYEEIGTFIDTKLRRGCTLFHVQGGYRREDTFALQTIISNRELFELKEAVLKIDPAAFMTISEVSEVSGRGFSLESDVPGDRHL